MYIFSITTIVAALVLLSAICSGLNIALMSLKREDLRRKAKLGDMQAKSVLPFRENSHLSLASILLTNVAVISATSLVLGHLLNGWIAGIASTLLIVLFGEVIPQALFVGHALSFCAWLAPLLQLMVLMAYPIAKPLQILLDQLLGPEPVQLQSRDELGLLIGEHAASEDTELDENELDIIKGALSLSDTRVKTIMTPVGKVFWLTPDAIIDAAKIDEIKLHGWSRIPIFDPLLTTCFGIIHMKDLVDIDFNERQYRIADLPVHRTRTIGSMMALDTLFRKFISQHTHLMPVEKDNRILGIVTIEDLLEAIIGHEIEDEGDVTRLRH